MRYLLFLSILLFNSTFCFSQTIDLNDLVVDELYITNYCSINPQMPNLLICKDFIWDNDREILILVTEGGFEYKEIEKYLDEYIENLSVLLETIENRENFIVLKTERPGFSMIYSNFITQLKALKEFKENMRVKEQKIIPKEDMFNVDDFYSLNRDIFIDLKTLENYGISSEKLIENYRVLETIQESLF